MKRVLFLLLAMAVLFSTAPVSAGDNYQKLDGIWFNNLMTVDIDVKNGRYSGINYGETIDNKMSLEKEYANVVILRVGQNQITVQFRRDGSILLTEKGGIPMRLNRYTEE